MFTSKLEIGFGVGTVGAGAGTGVGVGTVGAGAGTGVGVGTVGAGAGTGVGVGTVGAGAGTGVGVGTVGAGAGTGVGVDTVGAGADALKKIFGAKVGSGSCEETPFSTITCSFETTFIFSSCFSFWFSIGLVFSFLLGLSFVIFSLLIVINFLTILTLNKNKIHTVNNIILNSIKINKVLFEYTVNGSYIFIFKSIILFTVKKNRNIIIKVTVKFIIFNIFDGFFLMSVKNDIATVIINIKMYVARLGKNNWVNMVLTKLSTNV